MSKNEDIALGVIEGMIFHTRKRLDRSKEELHALEIVERLLKENASVQNSPDAKTQWVTGEHNWAGDIQPDSPPFVVGPSKD